MACLIGAGILAFFAAALLIAGIALERSAKSFEENARPGKAEVVGYDRADQSDWYTLLVRVLSIHDDNVYSCSAGKIDLARYPKGTVVDVLYAPKTAAGIRIVEVHLCDSPPADASRLGRGIRRFAFVLLLCAAVLLIAGFITIIY